MGSLLSILIIPNDLDLPGVGVFITLGMDILIMSIKNRIRFLYGINWIVLK